ncbi:MAG: Gfo/Idh/MocA family oxidoreductase [Pseudomonadota bacterium]
MAAPNPPDLGIGIIGCGNISAAYLRLAPLFKGIEMRAVADLNMEAASARAEEFGVRAETVDALLAAKDIDIIVNLTIPAAHFQVTRAILEAGKHAYSEKPFVLSVDDGRALKQIADEKALRIGSAPDTFLGGAYQTARQLVDDGAIGTVTAGTCHVMSHGMEDWHPNPDFFFQPGAGPMLDVGPYYITNLLQLLGPVRRIAALTSSAQAERTITSQPRRGEKIKVGTPTNIHALLEFHQGATITVSTSWDVWAHRHGPMELYGTKGSLFVPDPNFFGGSVELSSLGATPDNIDISQHPFSRPNDEMDDDPRANYRVSGLADMARAITEGGPHRCSFELALHAVDVMNLVLTSGEAGEFVQPSTVCERPQPLSASEASALLK